MTDHRPADNRRILIIDDNANIHEDFRKILAPPAESDSLGHARAVLFGEALTLPTHVRYELDFSTQGREGFGLAQSAHQTGNPYALAFVDMRMPPGWDGLETIEHLWYADPEIQIVICSAYSDHPWEDVSRRLGETDKLLILMKPFNSIEVVQLANSLTKKWNLARSVTQQIERLSSGVTRRTTELRDANERLQERVVGKMTEAATDQSHGEGAESLRQKEEFLAIMSHEIVLPMHELVGKVVLLLNGALKPEQREHLATVQRCAQDVLSLLKEMHEFMAPRKPEAQVGDSQERG
jgi:CheY-like chemotaxis protein